MLLIELIKSIIPTERNKRAHAERYQFNQFSIEIIDKKAKEILERNGLSPNDEPTELPKATFRVNPLTEEEKASLPYDPRDIIAELDRRESLKTPQKKKWETAYHNFCDRVYQFATRKWPVS